MPPLSRHAANPIAMGGEIDALSSVASHLDLASLGVLASVDHFFSASILADRAVWERLCETTFEGKVCIAAEAKRLLPSMDETTSALTDSALKVNINSPNNYDNKNVDIGVYQIVEKMLNNYSIKKRNLV